MEFLPISPCNGVVHLDGYHELFIWHQYAVWAPGSLKQSIQKRPLELVETLIKVDRPSREVHTTSFLYLKLHGHQVCSIARALPFDACKHLI